jgi:D-alanyl-lipoteichoic acid acyltransferase DltB (MBOAT superfamily)
LHGAALAIHKAWLEFVPWAGKQNSRWYNFLAGLLTFHFVCFCWIYFRADNVPTVEMMISRIFNNFSIPDIAVKVAAYWKPFAFILIGYFLHFLPKNIKIQMEDKFSAVPLALKVGIVAFVIIAAYQVASSEVQPFIYFQF